MANTITFIGKRLMVGNLCVKRYTVKLTGSYVSGGAVGVAGETLNFNSALNPGYRSRPKLPNGGASGALPTAQDFEVTQVPNGYSAQIEPNAVLPTANNMIMRLFGAGSGAANPAELASNTYATYGLLNAIIEVEVSVPYKNA